MGLFVLIGRDGPDGVALRPRHREAHPRDLRPLAEPNVVEGVFAGWEVLATRHVFPG